MTSSITCKEQMANNSWGAEQPLAVSLFKVVHVALVAVGLVVTLASSSAAQAQWGKQGKDSPLLEQLDIYAGASAGQWSFDVDEDGSLLRSYESQGAMVIAGVQLIESFVSIEQRFTSGGSAKVDGYEAELQGVWSTVMRISIDLTQWNQIYILGGVSGYHFEETAPDGELADMVNMTNFSTGLGLTHRVSENSWLFVERFFYDGANGNFNMEVSGGALYRF